MFRNRVAGVRRSSATGGETSAAVEERSIAMRLPVGTVDGRAGRSPGRPGQGHPMARPGRPAGAGSAAIVRRSPVSSAAHVPVGAGGAPTRSPASGAQQRLGLPELLRRLSAEASFDAVVLGGGCAGLALAAAVVDGGGSVAVVESRKGDRDGRTWCYWDTGEALLPEAVSKSWDRWEVRTTAGSTVARDVAHPYRMVHAHDYRAAARRRLDATAGSRIVDGTQVVGSLERTESPDVSWRAPHVIDARGPAPAGPVPPGRVALYQRFVGRWIRTTRPVFDDSTVTLMDFPDVEAGQDVRFFYVLPVAPDLALVECTVFARSREGGFPFRDEIAAYLLRRWGLRADGWSVEGEEAGCIPMTDEPPTAAGRATALGMRAGIARPSTGYAFTRIQIAARAAAAAIRAGDRPGAVRDRIRTRVLDAVFLRFLRDSPEAAPAVFLRMFDRLPGPLTVRFLTERSSPLDDLRLILALPKRLFLIAAVRTASERVGATAR